jgi:hypothetical protein
MQNKEPLPFSKMPVGTAVLGAGALVVVSCALTKSRMGTMVALLGGGYLLYKVLGGTFTPQVPFRFREPLPEGARPTGRVKDTTSGAKPGQEFIGFARKTWAEIMKPDGSADWFEVIVEGPRDIVV